MNTSYNKLDLTGQRFGRLVVVREEPRSKTGEIRWYCKCDCGGTVITTTHNLRSGDTKSCGCLHWELLSKDLTGKKFGRLTVVKHVGKNFRGSNIWLCQCECGKTTVLASGALVSGNTRSCGCLSLDTQRQRMIEYNTKYFDEDSLILSRRLLGMKARCYNKNCTGYPNYGGRGITICDEWLNDTMTFIKWAKTHGFKKELSLDRIDVNKGYNPENCRWTTRLVQNNNRRNNRVFKLRELTQSVARWIESLGLPKHYHKDLYSEPDHIIRMILLDRLTYIVKTLHLEHVRKASDILEFYSKHKDEVK